MTQPLAQVSEHVRIGDLDVTADDEFMVALVDDPLGREQQFCTAPEARCDIQKLFAGRGKSAGQAAKLCADRGGKFYRTRSGERFEELRQDL